MTYYAHLRRRHCLNYRQEAIICCATIMFTSATLSLPPSRHARLPLSANIGYADGVTLPRYYITLSGPLYGDTLCRAIWMVCLLLYHSSDVCHCCRQLVTRAGRISLRLFTDILSYWLAGHDITAGEAITLLHIERYGERYYCREVASGYTAHTHEGSHLTLLLVLLLLR